MKTSTLARTLSLMLVFLFGIQGAKAQTVQFGISATGTTLEVKIKSAVANTPGTPLTDLDVAIRWMTSYGVTLGNVTSSYGIVKGGPEYTSGAYTYQKFFYNALITPITIQADAELVVFSVPVNVSGSGAGTFELTPPGFVYRFPYIELDLVGVMDPVMPYYQSSTEVALPVELTEFTVKMDQLGAALAWKTATEKNNAGFDIERAAVGTDPAKKEWTRLGFVEGSGTCNAPKQYTFRNKTLQTGKYLYRLKEIDRDGRFTYSQEIEAVVAAPKEFTLSQNYPNPFNPTTTINFAIAENSAVTVKVYDIVGREIATLIDGDMPAGYYNMPFDARSLSSGIYLYRIAAKHGGSTFVQTKKMMLMK